MSAEEAVSHEQNITRRHYNGAMLCNGHTTAGELCKGLAVEGKTKCRKHGGLSPSGMLSATYKHGRYSKHLPTKLAQRYQEALSNPRLLSLDSDVALMEARLAQLLEQVDTGESAARWRQLQEALEAFSQAMAAGDLAQMDRHFATMRQVVQRGAADARAWEEVYAVVETRLKQVPAHVKTLQTLQQMLTVQQHMLMVGALTEAAVRAVQKYADVATGRKILTQMQGEFVALSTLGEER